MPDWLLHEVTGEQQRRDQALEYRRHLFRGVCWKRERCLPPLSDGELVRSVDNIMRLYEQHVCWG